MNLQQEYFNKVGHKAEQIYISHDSQIEFAY